MKDVFNVKDGERDITLTVVSIREAYCNFDNPPRVVIINEEGKKELRGRFSLPIQFQPDETLWRTQNSLNELKVKLKEIESDTDNYGQEDIDNILYEISSAEREYLCTAEQIIVECRTEKQWADEADSLEGFAEHINVWNANSDDWNDRYHKDIVKRNGWITKNLEYCEDVCREDEYVLTQNNDYGYHEVVYRPTDRFNDK